MFLFACDLCKDREYYSFNSYYKINYDANITVFIVELLLFTFFRPLAVSNQNYILEK